jgi:hypothetical protein
MNFGRQQWLFEVGYASVGCLRTRPVPTVPPIAII